MLTERLDAAQADPSSAELGEQPSRGGPGLPALLDALVPVLSITPGDLLGSPAAVLTPEQQRKLVLNNDLYTRLRGPVWARRNIGNAFFLRGDYALAAAALDTVGDLAVGGIALCRLGRWLPARSRLEQALSACPGPEISAALGVCLLLGRGVPELGLPPADTTEWTEARALLDAAAEVRWPAAVACRAWLELETDPPAWVAEPNCHPPEEPVALAALTEAAAAAQHPAILALACRALGYFDRREKAVDLARCAAGNIGPAGRLISTEAELEYGSLRSPSGVQGAAGQVAVEPWTGEELSRWAVLLQAEVEIATSGPRRRAADVSQALDALAEACRGADGAPAAPGEMGRIGARAGAASARCHMACGAWDAAAGALDRAAACLPLWEAAYLRALLAWGRGDLAAARRGLMDALSANPWQRRTRAELGLLVGRDDPQGALAESVHWPAERDLIACRAALHARLGYPQQAEQLMGDLAQGSANVPARLVLPGTVDNRLRQARLLRAHRAQARGDWAQLSGALDEVVGGSPAAGGLQARLLWARHQAEPRAEVAESLQALYRDAADDDTVFYRSLVAADLKPDRALADWLQLVGKQARLEEGLSMSPAQLLQLGDLLAARGVHGAAHAAYSLASRDRGALAQGRLELSALLRAVSDGQAPSEEALEACGEDAQGCLARALLHLSGDDPDVVEARRHLARAAAGGLPAGMRKVGELLCRLASGDLAAVEEILGSADQDGVELPAVVRTGLEMCVPGADIAALMPVFRQEAGRACEDLCPVDEEQAAAAQVIQAIEGGGDPGDVPRLQSGRVWSGRARLAIARAMGLRARQLGMEGEFTRARALVKDARALLQAEGSDHGTVCG